MAIDRKAPSSEPLLRVGVSSCLLGEEVRWNGGHKRDSYLLGTLAEYVEWVPVCPEVEIGLGTPREPIRLVDQDGQLLLVGSDSGSDHTQPMVDWSRRYMLGLPELNLHGYILKKDSPSCGLFRVKVYGEGPIPERSGQGLFARELVQAFPLLPVEEEGRLNDPALRENFIRRLFTYRRWVELLEADPSPSGLIAFHSAHKLTMLAQSPEHYKRMGQLVARAGVLPWDELSAQYGELLMTGMSQASSRGKHVNVMQHLMGFVKDQIDGDDKSELLSLMRDYQAGLVPLIVPLTLLKHLLRRSEVPEWVYEQVYLNPFPKELSLLNHV